MKEFIGTKIVKAAPALRLDDGNGNDRRKRFCNDDCRDGYNSRQRFLKGG